MEAQNLERLALGLTFSAIFAYGVNRFISIIMANLISRFAVISLLVCVMRGFVANKTNCLCIITCNRHKSGLSKYRYRANGQRMRENIAVFLTSNLIAMIWKCLQRWIRINQALAGIVSEARFASKKA